MGRIIAGVGALVVVLVATVVLAEDVDEAGRRAHRAPSGDLELAAAPPTTGPLPTTPIEAPSTTSGPRVATPPPGQPDVFVPPPPPPPPVTGSITISPASAPATVFLPPVLSWNTTNALTVQVSGPGFSSSAASGSATVCPGTELIADCMADNGTYTYTVRATDLSGALAFERSVTFTVG